MRNVTLAIEEDVLKAARQVALERNTTVNRMIREYLLNLIREDRRRSEAINRLLEKMKDGLYTAGPKTWSRDELHDR